MQVEKEVVGGRERRKKSKRLFGCFSGTCLHSFQWIIHFLLKWSCSPSKECLKGSWKETLIFLQEQLVIWGVNTSVRREGERKRESFIWLSDLTDWSACFSNHLNKPQSFFSHMHLSINAVYILMINKLVFILDVKTKQKPETCKPLSISVWWIFRSAAYWVGDIIKTSNWLSFRT